LSLDVAKQNCPIMSGQHSRRICVGRITGAHGTGGELKIKSFTDLPENIGNYGDLSDKSGHRLFRITGLRVVKGAVIARMDGVEDRNRALEMQGLELYITRDHLPSPDPATDEWYYCDLVGLRAMLADGSEYGAVTAIHNFGAGDLLEIKHSGGEIVLIPFTKQTVPAVDIAAGCMVVEPLEGI
jgi:16S rRNA processing protein RimM